MALSVQKTGESCFKTFTMVAFSKISNAETSTIFWTNLPPTTISIYVHCFLTLYSVCACSVCVNLSLVSEVKITKLFIRRKSWLAPQGQLHDVNSSQLFIKKRMKNFLARGGSVWGVTLLPGTTLLHINRPLASITQRTAGVYFADRLEDSNIEDLSAFTPFISSLVC